MGWETATLDQVCLFIRNGKSIQQSKEVDGLPITRIETIADQTIDLGRVGYAGLTECDVAGHLLCAGDILLSHINSLEHLGKTALYDGVPSQLVHGMNLLNLRPNPVRVEARYLLYALRSRATKAQILRMANKSVNQASVSAGNLKNLEIPLPPLPEQRRIAAILDKADALRAKRREAIAKLDQLLQSVFLEMFGDPVTNSKGWPIGKLADLGALDRGVSRQRPRGAPELLGGVHPLIQTGDVARSGGYIREFTATYSDAGLAQSKKWPAGTLCITIAANIADTGILTFDACFPDSVVGFTANSNSNAEFIQMLMSFLREILEEKAPQVAQKNINLAILRELPIPIPPVELQRKWAAFATRVEHMKQDLRVAMVCSDKLFESIQQSAFAGAL